MLMKSRRISSFYRQLFEMAKIKNKRKTAKRQTRIVSYRRQPMLDAKAIEYAKLLMDPCSAAICHPVYPGGDSGFLFRAESVGTFGAAATQDCGFVHWAPGYLNATSSEIIASAGTGGGASLSGAANSSAPGRQFLSTNASAVRCIAACMKITYPGAESARAGRIHYGHTQAGLIDSGDTTSVDALAPNLQHFGRTPPDTIELVWRPSIADTEFNDPRAAASATLRDRKSALTFAWAGQPAAVGMTIHFTAVYEWLPVTGTGLAADVKGKNTSNNTMDEVLDFANNNFSWVRSAVHGGLSSFGAGVGAGATNALLGTVTSYFGTMPARQMRASNRRLLG